MVQYPSTSTYGSTGMFSYQQGKTFGKLLCRSVPQFLLQCKEKTYRCSPETNKALPWKGSALGTGTCLLQAGTLARRSRGDHQPGVTTSRGNVSSARTAEGLQHSPRPCSSLPPLPAAPPGSS